MITTLLLAVAAVAPLGVRAEPASLGRGPEGTVVGVAFQVAPEDRERAGERVRVVITLLREGRVVDRSSALVQLAADGSGMVFREWAAGEAQIRVVIETLDGTASGAWQGAFVVPVEKQPFEPEAGAPADAQALAPVADSAPGLVRFKAPSSTGGIGALQLEVEAPRETDRIEFSQDGETLVTRRRAPWTVSVDLGEVSRRTTVRATAFRADGSLIGEDAIVLNGAAGQIPVEILLGPEVDGRRRITVAVTGRGIEEVTLHGDDELLGRWPQCPCALTLPADHLAAIKVLSAEARGERGARGEDVEVLGQEGFSTAIRVEQVELPVVVVDAQGRPVSGLAREAFRVFEDDEEQAVDAFATTADLPLSLALAVDTSGSMEDAFPAVRAAVDGFIDRLLRPGDMVSLVTFSFDAATAMTWTREHEAVSEKLARLKPEGGTSLHDAVVRSLEQFRGRRGRTALVLLTDGDDTTSRTGWDTALRFARTARVPIFPIGFRMTLLDFFVRDRLKELGEATGGQAFFPGKEGLEAAYRSIGEQLRAQYLISYRSSSPRRGFRQVRVEVAGEGLTVRTISGYYPTQ